MKVLFIGDIFARPGREMVARTLPRIFETEKPDFVAANAENAAGGKGLTPKTAYELFNAGVDVLTLGDHVWDRKEILEIIDDKRILRPLNLPQGNPGRGRGLYTKGGNKLCVAVLMGRTFIERPMDCPFAAAAKEVFDEPTLIDFHAEATSEKIAMKWFLAGRVSALLGTHTHIATDDAVIEKGSAYITDCGMTGAYDSVIGVDKDIIIKRFLTGMTERFEPGRGDAQFHGVMVDIEGTKAVGIRKIRHPLFLTGRNL